MNSHPNGNDTQKRSFLFFLRDANFSMNFLAKKMRRLAQVGINCYTTCNRKNYNRISVAVRRHANMQRRHRL